MASRLDKWVLTVIPAYGRDYTDACLAVEAWNKGLDFKLPGGGPYLAKGETAQLKSDGFTHVNVMFSKREKNVEIEI